MEAGDLKLDAGGNYAELDYYLRTTAYRFLSLCAIARQFETEAFYIDARIAEARDLEFLKFVKALRWALTDLELVEGVVTQGDNFYNDELRLLCDLCIGPTGKVITLTEFSSRATSESEFGLVLRFFDGLRPDEPRLRWDRLVAFHLIVMAFVNSIGYDMQQADDERFARTAAQLRNQRVAENLANAIPRLGLGASPEAQRIVRALPGDLAERRAQPPRRRRPCLSGTTPRTTTSSLGAPGGADCFLGAGANLCRPSRKEGFEMGGIFPAARSSRTCALYCFDYPADRANKSDLIRVAQWASVSGGESALTSSLSESSRLRVRRRPFTRGSRRFRADPRRQPERDRQYPLIITANYDDSLELALDTANEPYDLVAYHRGSLIHWVCEPGLPRGRASGDRVATGLRRRRSRQAHGDPQGPRTGRPDRPSNSRASSSPRTTTSSTSPGSTSRGSCRHAHRAPQAQQLSVPRLQPARLEPASDPPADLARAAREGQELGRPQGDRRRRRGHGRTKSVEIVEMPLDSSCGTSSCRSSTGPPCRLASG